MCPRILACRRVARPAPRAGRAPSPPGGPAGDPGTAVTVTAAGVVPTVTRTPRSLWPPHHPRRVGDGGSATAELVLLTPVLILLLLFLLYCTRLTTSRVRIADVAHQAARAASLAATPAQAGTDARTTAEAALDGAGLACHRLTVATDPAGLAPGTPVRVTVSCTVPLGDLALLGVPGRATLHATATSPVDRHGPQAAAAGATP